MKKFSLIAAADEEMGIGKNNTLPWRIKQDLAYFHDVTSKAEVGKKNVVIMGRRTWESLPDFARPLKERTNMVLTRSEMEAPPGAILTDSLPHALKKSSELSEVGEIFVIGGANVYAQAIVMEECERIYLTEVQGKHECDAFFPMIDLKRFQLEKDGDWLEENGKKFRFLVYTRVSF